MPISIRDAEKIIDKEYGDQRNPKSAFIYCCGFIRGLGCSLDFASFEIEDLNNYNIACCNFFSKE